MPHAGDVNGVAVDFIDQKVGRVLHPPFALVGIVADAAHEGELPQGLRGVVDALGDALRGGGISCAM